MTIREGDSILGNKNVGIITNIQLDMIARKQYKVHWANGQVGWLDHNTTSQFRENYLQYDNQSR
jgi:hypothetical protein